MSAIALPGGGRRAAPKSTNLALSPPELVAAMVSEGRRRLLSLTGLFALIAVATLLGGMFLLPYKYQSSTSILVQNSDIIGPLLEGRAVPTDVTDRAGIARQVVYSRKVLEGALEAGGWSQVNMSPGAREALVESIRNRTSVRSPRDNLIEITFADSDPDRTYEVTKRLADLFITETLETKERESREAYEFISQQVDDYHRKLTDAESNLMAYRSANPDAQPGSATDSSSRISSLRGQVEQTRMVLMEQRSRSQALNSQLSGEASVTAVQTRESLYRAQLVELQGQLDSLLLQYTEQHPDVVRIRHQMADIQQVLQRERQSPQLAQEGGFGDTRLNPMYQELRSRLAESNRDASATASRLAASQEMLNEEMNRSRRIAASESTLAELTRDYEVNRDIYQDLLRRRENARVSMRLDSEQRGLTMRIQDPAERPIRPTGLRLMHLALAGLLLAIAVPLGLLFLQARFDPRLRSGRQVASASALPLLTVIPTYRTRADNRAMQTRFALSGMLVLAVIAVYAAAWAFKQMGA